MSGRTWRAFDALPRAYGGPSGRGRLRQHPEDFLVDELLGFAPDGEGEHALLRIRKTGANTEWVARRLAAFAGMTSAAVGYAGLKDRHALATQWFSVHTPRRQPDWGAFQAEGVEILESHRHRRKLRRGALQCNRFAVRIRDLTADSGAFERRWSMVTELGAPNYFGPQRFGRGEGNLHAAQVLFAGKARRASRHLRGLWLSAARSQLFNEVLAERVKRGDWDQPIAGDRMQLAGSHSHFLLEAPTDDARARTRAFDLDPTGPLWGAGELDTAGDAAALERLVMQDFPEWTEGLARAGLDQERRPLRLRPVATELAIADRVVELLFTLPAGGFATAVLRELVHWLEPG